MRQIGSLASELHARRLAAYLVTQGIDAHCEPDGQSWDIWVRDEDHLEQANAEFSSFEQNPDSETYWGVEQQADELRRQTQLKREQAQKNIVEMRSNWTRASRRRRPLTVTIVGLCVLTGMLTGFGRTLDMSQGRSGPVMSALLFLDPHHYYKLTDDLSEGRISQQEYEDTLDNLAFRLTDVRKGQVWRTVTPAFLHGDILHIAMNMWMFFILGGLVESRYGTPKFGILVVAFALPSQCAQSLLPIAVGGSVVSLGMSGVVFGLFGFAWMKSSFDSQAGFRIPPSMVILLLAYFFIGVSGIFDALGNIGHWAHGVGLACGMLIGYFPEVFKSLRGR